MNPDHRHLDRALRVRTRSAVPLCLLALLSVLPSRGLAEPPPPPESDWAATSSSIPFEVFQSWTDPENFASFLQCFTPDFGTVSGKRIIPPAGGRGPYQLSFTSVPKKFTSRALVSKMDVAMNVSPLAATACGPGKAGISFDLAPSAMTIVTSVGVSVAPSLNGAHARLTLCGNRTADGMTALSLGMTLHRPSAENQDPTLRTLVSPHELLRNNLNVLLQALSPGGCALAALDGAGMEMEEILDGFPEDDVCI